MQRVNLKKKTLKNLKYGFRLRDTTEKYNNKINRGEYLTDNDPIMPL